MSAIPKLVVVETHPVQYHAPVYRAVQEKFSIPVTAIYGSDFSVQGYRDREFGAFFSWDTDLLSGYEAIFLSRVAEGGADSADVTSAQGLSRVLEILGPSVVLLTGYGGQFYRGAIAQLWKRRNPLLFRAETTDHGSNRNAAKAWLRDQALRRLYARCAQLMYIGQHSYRHLTRLGCPAEKLFFSPYCVDASRFQCDEKARASLRPETRAELGIAESDIVLLFSGKLTPKKAPQLILEAVRQLPEDLCRRCYVLYMGDGELRGQIDSLCRQQPAVRARLLGFQNQTALSRYFHAADLLILPTLHSETWGLVVNEALHHGVPCVVSDAVGSAADLIRPSTGAVCQTGSANSLAEAIAHVYPLLARLETRAACRLAVSSYGVEDAARGIAQAFESITAESRADGQVKVSV